jgi:hypothetical protein
LPCPPPCDFRFLLSQFQLFRPPARALAAETLKLERARSDLVNQAYALTPAEIELLWQTAPPRMPIPSPRFPGRESHGRFAGNAPRNSEIERHPLQRNAVAPPKAPL